MRWLSWDPPSRSGKTAEDPGARRSQFLRQLALSNARRARGLLAVVVAVNCATLLIMFFGWGRLHDLEVDRTVQNALMVHRGLWILLDLAFIVLLGQAGKSRWPQKRLGLLVNAAILANMLLVVAFVLPLYGCYANVSLYYVAMFCLVPLIRLDALASFCVIGLPALLLIAGILCWDPWSGINVGNSLSLLAMAGLSLVGMRYLFIEGMRDLLQRDIIARQQAELGRLALTDALTGLANRRGLDACLDREWRRSVRANTPLAAIMLDIDHFKRYNDTQGHAAGDACLCRVAATVSGCLRRAGDMAARYGGEEFVVLLPGTDAAGARILAEAIRLAVMDQDQSLHGTPLDRVTVSLGVAARLTDVFDTPQALLARADAALYAAKAAGRNRTCPAGDFTPDDAPVGIAFEPGKG